MGGSKIKVAEDHAELRVNAGVYSKETLFAVGYVFLDKAYILLDIDKRDMVVYLYPQQKKTDLRQLCLEFCNELVNYAHYFSRVKHNAEAIKVMMQRALFSAAPSLVQEAEEKEIDDLIKKLEEEEDEEDEEDQEVLGKKSAAAVKKRKRQVRPQIK